MKGYLLVRSDGTRLGLPLEQVVEVVDDAEATPIPGVAKAVRGVAQVRGRLIPMVHLGALLTGGMPQGTARGTVVVATCGDGPVAFEVDDADAVVRETALPVPPGRQFPWASGVAAVDDELIPILDFEILAERLVMRQDGEIESA